MDKRIRIAGIAAAVAFAVWVWVTPSNVPPIPEPPTGDADESVSILAQNLDKPRHMALAGDTLFVTERKGSILMVQDGVLAEDPVATLRPVDSFDSGLTGIAAHPQFESNGLLYVYISYMDGDALLNRIMEIHVQDGKLSDAAIILEGIPGSRFTNGGAMKFGPDGMLYVGTGTPSDSSHQPQDTDSLAGKILRINADGTIPPDNPYPDSPIYSLGHRSPQGLAWDADGMLYVSETGPEKNDEVNAVTPGSNHGWPETQCGGAQTVLCYDPAIEPGGIVFSTGGAATKGHLVLASLHVQGLFAIDLEEGISSQHTILSGVGRIRDVVQAPDGSLYVITSNTDGKGFPIDTDDSLLWIRP